MLRNRHHILFFGWPLWFQRGILLALLATATAAHAQFNDWISPVSGDWEVAANWSAGLPNSNQFEVRIINTNSKAVAIQPTTPVNFPDSMTVQNLRVGGVPPNANLLLMNFFGTTPPLRVLNDFNIETHGRVLMLSSGLSVSNALNVSGVFDQEAGELTFTNSSATTMQIEGGRFNLTNGLVTGANMFLGGTNDGYVNQDSGLVSLAWLMLGSKPTFPNTSNGTYVLQSGWLIVSVLEGVGQTGFGMLTHNGGTNSASDLFVGNGTYMKNGGGLFAGEVRVVAPSAPIFAPPTAILTHAGGTATITNDLRLLGQGNRLNPRAATFNMFGGSLSAHRILMEGAAMFTQSNGTVKVANELIVDDNGRVPSSCYLSGGNLFTSGTTLSSSYPESSSIGQSGGTHLVTNTLRINGNAIYRLSGGTVTAPNIVLTGNIHDPPQFFVYNAPPFAVTNETISLLGGAIVIENSAQQFGRLEIESDAGINLAGDSAVLRFADSHTNSWQSQLLGVVPRLTVFNWNGSTNGGGPDQLIFGASSPALTASQLAQIWFVNPAGFSSGTYPSRILSTGEVVPMPRPALSWQSNGTNLVTSWAGNFILQSATNVVGPYFDVTNATSPYRVDVHQFPMQFFRLRD
jgi:hypothetical protein